MDFSQLSLLVVVAALFGFLARLLRQPLLVGYLFAGFFLSWSGLIVEHSALESMGKIGVALLLFLLGLEMNLKEVATIGKHATVAGFFEMLLTAICGFILSLWLGFTVTASVYISVALTFSSTIIMVKLLSEKKDLSSLYGKISVGSLLFQDLVAIFILIFLSGLGAGGSDLNDYLQTALKFVILVGSIWIFAKRIGPVLFEKFVAGSSELLYIFSIAWALGVSSFVAGPLGFSLEIGGFLAGLSLSTLPEHLQIAARSRTLRDFFLTIFFIYLGTQMVIEGSLVALLPAAILLSLIVLVINPLSVMVVMGYMGYKKRTAFLSALTVSQTSEFSLILMAVGATLGHVGQSDVAVVVLITAITMTVSTYLISGSEKLYKYLSRHLKIFERKNPKEVEYSFQIPLKDHVILLGCDRAGRVISKYLKSKEIAFLVVDFNPQVVRELVAENVNVIFGDISDPDIWEDTKLFESKMVISTIPSTEDNLLILEKLKSLENRPTTIFVSTTKKNALKLYESGANYVIVPEIIAGEHIRQVLRFYGMSKKRLTNLGQNHFKRLISM